MQGHEEMLPNYRESTDQENCEYIDLYPREMHLVNLESEHRMSFTAELTKRNGKYLIAKTTNDPINQLNYDKPLVLFTV